LGSSRDVNYKLCPFSLSALCCYCTTIAFNNLTAHREPNTGTLITSSTMQTLEYAEYPLLILLIKPYPVIFDGDGMHILLVSRRSAGHFHNRRYAFSVEF